MKAESHFYYFLYMQHGGDPMKLVRVIPRDFLRLSQFLCQNSSLDLSLIRQLDVVYL